MELTDRKKQILKIVVDGYVATAEPVSSKAIAEKMPGRISSATIRNELADLVEMGYLEQPHTSAGRVPSARGYRLYVNELMEHRALPEAEAESIRRSLTGKMSGDGPSGPDGLQHGGLPRLCRGGPHAGGDGAAVRPHCRGR